MKLKANYNKMKIPILDGSCGLDWLTIMGLLA